MLSDWTLARQVHSRTNTDCLYPEKRRVLLVRVAPDSSSYTCFTLFIFFAVSVFLFFFFSFFAAAAAAVVNSAELRCPVKTRFKLRRRRCFDSTPTRLTGSPRRSEAPFCWPIRTSYQWWQPLKPTEHRSHSS